MGENCGSWVCGACAVRWGFACERPRKPLPSRCAARGGGGCAAGRGTLACCSGGWRLFAAPRRMVAARRGEVSLASCSGGCFLRFAPRGVLRWCGARGALRPLFLLRSCAADQEKRPEKKSWALMACAPVRPERLGNMCIRSAPRCISRWQRERRILLAAWERDLGENCGSWVCGACAVRWGLSGLLPRRAAPCSVTGTGAAGCC